MQRSRIFKLRFRRRFKHRTVQAQGIGAQAEASFDSYFLRRLEHLKPVRRFIFGWITLLLLLTIGVLLQISNLTNYYKTLQPIAGGTYREGVLGTFSTANPLYATSDVDSSVAHLIFSGLFKYNQQNTLVGDLAANYEVNDIGTVYTVHLKPNLRWQDNKPLTSADVVFTYQAIQNPDTQSPLKNSWQGIKITAPNASTVVFKLPSPLASFPTTMINGIVPQHLLKKISPTELRTADFNTIKPIGSGPFKWQGIQVSGNDPSNAQVQLALVPFNGYVGGAPKLDRFIVHAYADQQQLINDFKNGSLTGVAGLLAVPRGVSKQQNIQVHNLLLTAGTYVFFKTSQPILASQKVRQALVQATNQSAIIKRLGFATKPVNSPLLKGQLAYTPTLVQPKYDVAAASAALDSDGWTMGKDGIRVKNNKPLSFNIVATDTPEYRLVTRELRQQWQQIGVKLNVRLQSVTNFQNTLAYHDYDAVLYGISIGTDPDVFVYWDSSQADIRSSNRLNLSEYKNATADAALEAGRTRLDPVLRTIKYKPFLQAWQQDLPALGLYQPRVLYLTNVYVSGFYDQTVNTATDRYNNVQNWMIRQAKITNRY